MAIIISHRKDLDGIASAAILKRAFPDASVLLIDYDNIRATFRSLESVREEVYVADLNIGAAEKKSLQSIAKIAKNARILWLDHHNWDPAVRKDAEKHITLVVNRDKCAAEVVFDFFGEGDSVDAKIARFARDQDFYTKKIYDANRISDMIAARYDNIKFLLSLVGMLSRGTFWKDEFDEIRNAYIAKKEKLLSESIGDITYYGNFAVTLSNPLVPSGEIAKETIEKKRIDVLVILDPMGRISFRRRKGSSVDLSAIAREFGGGGHPYAAGASYGKEISKKTLPAAKKSVAAKVQKWLSACL